MEQEKFIERILNSTNGIVQVIPDEHLFSKIKARIEDEKPAENYVKCLVAASIVLLISLNAGVLSRTNSSKKQTTELSQLVETTNNQLY
jgi:hypothetical protein